MIKKYIPFYWKAQIILFLLKFKKKRYDFVAPDSKTPIVYIFLAADYGNLGDVAITYAQHKFLRQTNTDYKVVQIPISSTLEGIAQIKKTFGPEDIITIVGGGNMGDLYPMIETYRQLVIRNFKKSRIICFPQTVDFSDTPKGRKLFKKTKKTIDAHSDIFLLAREQKSFDFFQKNFTKAKVFLVPDIVMTLKCPTPSTVRKGVVISLRSDKEKKLTANEEASLLNIVKDNLGEYLLKDTYIGGSKLSLLNRTRKLNEIWNHFSKAELVITDRLHGMIFAYITNTPALVFLNNNHKIQSSYEWIKHDPKIQLVKDFNESRIVELIKDLRHDTVVPDNEKSLSKHYQKFLESFNNPK